jgi:hypothetical protein
MASPRHIGKDYAMTPLEAGKLFKEWDTPQLCCGDLHRICVKGQASEDG